MDNEISLQQVQSYFQRRRLILLLLILVLGMITLIAAQELQFKFSALITGVFGAFAWMAQNFLPTPDALTHFGEVLTAMISTIGASIASTLIGAGLALFLAILGATPTAPHPAFSYLIRYFASTMRNIPIVVWAIILLFSFKQNDMTGLIALGVNALGYLTRSFMETIESSAGETIEALQATGASYWPIIFQGVVPAAEALFMSALLYMIENNVRDATLVGILTGTGIGSVYDLYFKRFDYATAGLALLFIVVFVMGLEIVSNRVRRAIL